MINNLDKLSGEYQFLTEEEIDFNIEKLAKRIEEKYVIKYGSNFSEKTDKELWTKLAPIVVMESLLFMNLPVNRITKAMVGEGILSSNFDTGGAGELFLQDKIKEAFQDLAHFILLQFEIRKEM